MLDQKRPGRIRVNRLLPSNPVQETIESKGKICQEFLSIFSDLKVKFLMTINL